MKRRSAILLAGALLALLFVTANLLVSRLVGGRQLDATASGRYTLTEESLKTVAALRQPVTIRLYVSEKLQSAWDELGAHAARTTAFLARCVLAAPDKIRLEIRRIKPFSDMEKQAVSEGMLPFPENEEELYFGLKVIAADGRSALIPALKPERRALLESDLNRILHGLNGKSKSAFFRRGCRFRRTEKAAPSLLWRRFCKNITKCLKFRPAARLSLRT